MLTRSSEEAALLSPHNQGHVNNGLLSNPLSVILLHAASSWLLRRLQLESEALGKTQTDRICWNHLQYITVLLMVIVFSHNNTLLTPDHVRIKCSFYSGVLRPGLGLLSGPTVLKGCHVPRLCYFYCDLQVLVLFFCLARTNIVSACALSVGVDMHSGAATAVSPAENRTQPFVPGSTHTHTHRNRYSLRYVRCS